jgi:hypothetical protein
VLLPCVDLADDGVTSIADDGGGVGRPVRWLRMGPWPASCQAGRCGYGAGQVSPGFGEPLPTWSPSTVQPSGQVAVFRRARRTR